jgi:hypothetical protein
MGDSSETEMTLTVMTSLACMDETSPFRILEVWPFAAASISA